VSRRSDRKVRRRFLKGRSCRGHVGTLIDFSGRGIVGEKQV